MSHDQDFLNSVCQEILHIEDCKLASYKGNYDSFKKAEKTKLKQQQKAWEKQEKRLRELKRSGQSKAKATEQVKKNKREPGARSAKKKQDQAIAAGTAAAETQELIKRPREYHVKLEFAEVAELSRPVLEVNRVHFRYSPKHPIIFDRIDFGIDMDSRICVVGVSSSIFFRRTISSTASLVGLSSVSYSLIHYLMKRPSFIYFRPLYSPTELVRVLCSSFSLVKSSLRRATYVEIPDFVWVSTINTLSIGCP